MNVSAAKPFKISMKTAMSYTSKEKPVYVVAYLTEYMDLVLDFYNKGKLHTLTVNANNINWAGDFIYFYDIKIDFHTKKSHGIAFSKDNATKIWWVAIGQGFEKYQEE